MTAPGSETYRPYRDLAVFAAARSHLDALDDLLLSEASLTPEAKAALDALSRYTHEGFNTAWDACGSGTYSADKAAGQEALS